MPTLAQHPYASFLHRVEKPARYAGGEVGEAEKDWDAVEARVCLAFPDVYDIGMSHLGYKILYKILNDDARTLAERCYAPWVDMEAELRTRSLPLVSLESARSLSEFDVVGLSLQFELTYTNCLTILELGGIALRTVDRPEDAPLVLGGGPTATHPEPIAPFFDAFVVGDGEEKLTEVALTWVRLRKAGVPRAERLGALAALGGVYVPSLYAVKRDPDTGFLVVDHEASAPAPLPIHRAHLADIDRYPFPTDSPVGGPEAIFDRMSIEIARGCTEGCRFCQAGMIYRPVRERNPETLVRAVARAVRESGYDEVSLTSLSTADYSCISPLISKIGAELRGEKVALGVSSLRAYGLGEEVLEEIGSVRATGLTFAPEAGTQRMRDVINKNVTEEQLLETAQRVFSRGWSKMKLYFMIGLPTETDDDVRGIVETGSRTHAVGRRLLRGRAKVTVSVSSHVPKPHTPFQWCAIDPPAELERKQRLLLGAARAARIDLRLHDVNESTLEGVFARGDRALADVIEHAYRHGARFDSWQDQLRLELWKDAFEACGVEPNLYLGTIPVDARLPWDHIDVGLADGFLATEYRKSLKSRLSPPCGKQYGRFVHYANVEDAEADQRPLVCYDCGIGCDLTKMRAERIAWLTALDARRRLPLAPTAPTEGAPAPTETAPLSAAPTEATPASAAPAPKPARRGPGVPRSRIRYRFQLEKLGPAALLGHLDLVRALPRSLRRAGLDVAYSQGFHPKPELTFSPALSLGVPSLAEYIDVRLASEPSEQGLLDRLSSGSTRGLRFVALTRLAPEDPPITKVLTSARYLIAVRKGPTEESYWQSALAAFFERASCTLARVIEGRSKQIDVRAYVESAELACAEARQAAERLHLEDAPILLDVHATIRGSGGVKVFEILRAIGGDAVSVDDAAVARLGLYGGGPEIRVRPFDLLALRPPKAPLSEAPEIEPAVHSAADPEAHSEPASAPPPEAASIAGA